MARYKDIDTSPRLLPVDLSRQLLPGTFEHALNHLFDHEIDLAALDAMSWSMMVRWDHFAQDLKVVGFTDLTPGLPLITGQAELVDTLFAVISAAISGLSNRDRDLLSLRGLIKIDRAAYLAVPTPPSPDKCEAALRLT